MVTEYCVKFAAKGLLEWGRKVTVVSDAIETLSREAGEQSISEMKVLGAKLVTTDEVLRRIANTK